MMNKVRLLILLLFCSCASITEEIYINKDGSGEYLVYSDVISSTRSMMVGMMSSLYPDASEDSLMQVIDAQIWADMPNEVDSLIDFSSRVPDSIRNDPEKQKYLDRMEMFMRGSREKGYLNSGMSFKFEAVSDLEDFLEFMSDNQSATGEGMGMDLPNMRVRYDFDGNTFSRTTLMDEDLEVSDSTMMMLQTMLADSKSRLIIHLPKNVKKASKDQLVETKGKDVVYEFDLLKVINGEQTTDVKVDF